MKHECAAGLHREKHASVDAIAHVADRAERDGDQICARDDAVEFARAWVSDDPDGFDADRRERGHDERGAHGDHAERHEPQALGERARRSVRAVAEGPEKRA